MNKNLHEKSSSLIPIYFSSSTSPYTNGRNAPTRRIMKEILVAAAAAEVSE